MVIIYIFYHRGQTTIQKVMGDFPYIDHLARLYKQKGEESGTWTDYLKVMVFAIAVL